MRKSGHSEKRSMLPIQIRRAHPSDAPAIYRLIKQATKRGKVLKRSLAEIRRSWHSFFVAEIDQKVVGCCALEVYNKKLAEIRSLSVKSNWEGRGVASALLLVCKREAKRKRVYEVFVVTNRENIFSRHGFRQQLHDQKALFLRPNERIHK